MKIISKYKDYYDYLSGVYGIDDLIVYDRRFEYVDRDFEMSGERDTDYKRFTIYFCGKQYIVYLYKGEWYHTPDDLEKLDKTLKADSLSGILGHHYTGLRKKISSGEHRFKADGNLKEVDINHRFRQPILIQSDWRGEYTISREYGGDLKYNPVLLKDYGFAKWYPADDVWKEVYAFISYMKDHPPIPDKMTNNEKILSHGFDLKQSFRNTK